jgi:hypothetical protein
MLVSFRIRRPAYFRVRVGLIVRGGLSAEGFPFCASLFRELDTSDTAPALAALRRYLAHLFNGMMGAAVVAERSFRHQFFLTGSVGPLGRLGLFVRPIDAEQPATMMIAA